MTARTYAIRRLSRTVLAANLALAALPLGGFAQQNGGAGGGRDAVGRIVGRIVDAQTGAALNGVQLQIVASGVGALSGVDGRFAIEDVPAGLATLRVESLGYATKTITGVNVPAGGAVEQNITMELQALELTGIEVTAAAERGSVSRALDQQRTSSNIVNAITSEQISRSPDGDAAAALQRVSGVTVQDGKYVFVRGLGERYTTTSLNGARIPSPEPERKVVPLDLFPSGLLQTITTSKTFTPDLPGDFSGAQVNIETKEFPADRQFTYSLSVGANDRIAGNLLPFAPTVGGEWLAAAGSERALPAAVRDADFTTQLSQDQVNALVGSFRNAWSVQSERDLPNLSGGFSLGGTDPILGQRISYLVSGTYSRSSEVKADEVRAQAIAGPDGTTLEVDRFAGTTARNSVLLGGLLNASTLVGDRTRLLVNATYNRTSDNEGRSELGFNEQFNIPMNVERLRFVERSVYSAQVAGEHELGDRHRVDWTATASGVDRDEPDRSEIVYAILDDPATGQPLPPAWFSGSNEGAVRTFSALTEKSYEGSANYRLSIGDPARQHAIKIGGVARTIERDALTRIFSISSSALGQSEREQEPEVIFDGRYADEDDRVFRIAPFGQGGQYTAADHLLAGYAQLEYGLSDRIRIIGGARLERSRTEVTATPTIGAAVAFAPEYTDVLPALTVNIDLTDTQNLRFSASQTLARPEYRELAPITYREVIGGDNVRGQPDLERTLIRNLDARWEWYPNAGEVVSIGFFAKDFVNPIERIYRGTSGTRLVTFVNAAGASNYGAEIELRKRLGTLAEALEPLSFFTNATIMQSEIRLPEDAATNPDRAMVGQAPYVLNAGLTWAGETGATSATVLYNIVGKRIFSASETPLPEIYEQARNVLDLSLRFGLPGAFSAKLDVKNVLDEPYELTQGSVQREYYRAGRVLSLGLSWKR
jgi:TonB dependent receptor/Carboxypeptidase regulatory-like domain/TonB-dependent Receptor Plug Domain